MTGKCLSIRRSIPANSISARNNGYSRFFSNSVSLSYNKYYNFQMYAEKDDSIIVCWGPRGSLKKDIGGNG